MTVAYLYLCWKLDSFNDEPAAAWIGLAAFVWGDSCILMGLFCP